MNTVAFIKTGDGNITLILNAKNFSIGNSHPNYQKILDALRNQAYDGLETLVDIPAAITARFGGNKGSVTVQNGQVLYRGRVMHNTVTERILAFLSEGLPTQPLVRFLENLLENPVPAAVDELFDFLSHQGFPITEDGCFIGYKGIRNDWLDCHTGTMDNSIGKIVSMDRKLVDPDRRNECSQGLHVGTLEYASGHAGNTGRVVLVKVNPRDCIAVPKDYNCSKLRACQYEVMSEAAGLIETPMWPMPAASTPQGDCEYVDDEDDGEDFGDGWEDSYPDDYDDEDETVETTVTTVTTKTKPKRAACAYCGAKGGKKHDRKCKRPRK